MILYYAMGGGLGHLTRARAFLHTLGVEKEAAILTSSAFAADKRIVGEIRTIAIDKIYERNIRDFRAFLKKTFAEQEAKSLYIDAFPFGIGGEFAGFDFPEKLEVNYVARSLKWKTYSTLFQSENIRFSKSFIIETLEDAHRKFINDRSDEQTEIELKYPAMNSSAAAERRVRHIIINKIPFWLIVHAGDAEEIAELFAYAAEMRRIENSRANLILISPNEATLDEADAIHLNVYPADALFPDAERIFTACGFNSMEMTKNFRRKHYFIPFERRFDDQFARAKRAR